MIFNIINILCQMSKVSYDLISEDPNGIIPPYRVSSELPLDPVPSAASFVFAIREIMLAYYLVLLPDDPLTPIPQDLATILDAMRIEYAKPVSDHEVVIDRPPQYPTLEL